MPLALMCGEKLLDQSASQCSLWQIGEVVEELLEQYEIDLSESPMHAVELGVSDDALAVCA
ncbi:MAG TPA: hypothetical protein VJ783_16855 [Pirellulales bacterium]|nr:hypothetical protein [Pirellulales bacterium]